MLEVKNRRENVLTEKIPPVIRDPSAIVEEAVKEVSKTYRLSKATYTELKNSLGKPALYYGDFEVEWGAVDGVTQFRVERLYFSPVKVDELNTIEFYASCTYGKQVDDTVVRTPAIMCLVATTGDTPASRIGSLLKLG